MMSVVGGIGTDATTSSEYFIVISVAIMMVIDALVGWVVVNLVGSRRFDAAVPRRHYVKSSVTSVADDSSAIDFMTF